MQTSNLNQDENFIEENEEGIFVKIGNVLKRIYFKEIDWFGVDGKHAFAKTETRNYPLNISLKNLEDKLRNKNFIRVHQSFMINVKKIESIKLIENIVVVEGKELPIGGSFKKQFLKQINCF